jgi:lipopolysaccharide transport system ATP-binding protein
VTDTVIRVEALGKRYRIGEDQVPYRTLRESLVAGALAPFRKRRRIDEPLWALREVSFEVARGEVVGIIGRNGAGKTTLLKILARITRPTTGQAEIRGHVGSLLETGTGFQRELTGRENVFLNGAILGMRKAEVQRRLDEIVDFADIGRFLDTELKHYSTGMQVRLAFAVAAHLRPEILLLDEVLAVGDVEFQKKCMGMMENVTGEGRTVLLVSHSLGAIKALCTRAVLLDHGRLLAAGTVEAVVSRYLAEIHAEGAAARAVTRRDHFSPSEHIQVEQVRLLDAVADGFRVHWRQAITLRVIVRVLTALEGVSFGVGVRGPDGTAVLTVHHDDDGAPSWSFQPGLYAIALTLRNDLRPGFYRIHVGAHQHFHDARHLFAADVAALEVLEYGEDGRPALPSNTGIVNGIATWKAPEPTA